MNVAKYQLTLTQFWDYVSDSDNDISESSNDDKSISAFSDVNMNESEDNMDEDTQHDDKKQTIEENIQEARNKKKETLFKDDTVDKENNLSLLTQPILDWNIKEDDDSDKSYDLSTNSNSSNESMFKPFDIDLDDTTDNDIDLYHEFLLNEFGLNHEDVGHKHEIDYLIQVLEKYDAYCNK